MRPAATTLMLFSEFEDLLKITPLSSILPFSSKAGMAELKGMATSQKDLAMRAEASFSGSNIVEASVGDFMDNNSTQ